MLNLKKAVIAVKYLVTLLPWIDRSKKTFILRIIGHALQCVSSNRCGQCQGLYQFTAFISVLHCNKFVAFAFEISGALYKRRLLNRWLLVIISSRIRVCLINSIYTFVFISENKGTRLIVPSYCMGIKSQFSSSLQIAVLASFITFRQWSNVMWSTNHTFSYEIETAYKPICLWPSVHLEHTFEISVALVRICSLLSVPIKHCVCWNFWDKFLSYSLGRTCLQET